mmetsp:Transcript_36039/g.66230  ORF Transcript_36039/g.66230 Transcript_36039/m.66230 type:complete len:327 (-) Transcript_36039:67-1047(-)
MPEGGSEAIQDDAGELSGHMELIHSVFSYLEDAGWEGYWLLIVLFSAYVCLALPSTPVEIATGFMYGPFWGSVCGTVSKTVGSTLAFFIGVQLGRQVLSDEASSKVPAVLRPRLAALQDQPCLTMIGIRLAPLPLAVKNYGLALCRVPIGPYIFASLVVNTPFSVLWALTGASCHSLLDALSFRTSSKSGEGGLSPYVTSLLPAAGSLILLILLVGRFSLKPAPAASTGERAKPSEEADERKLMHERDIADIGVGAGAAQGIPDELRQSKDVFPCRTDEEAEVEEQTASHVQMFNGVPGEAEKPPVDVPGVEALRILHRRSGDLGE